jgi:hypothetical protein
VTTFERTRMYRASLYCTTCETVVAVGGPAPEKSLACFCLGANNGRAILDRHLGKCAGGQIVVLAEELPAPAPLPPLLSPPGRRRTRSLG